jgi:catechol 2,3-dioxygenase-like lactoylglutathione lyase family enzyme
MSLASIAWVTRSCLKLQDLRLHKKQEGCGGVPKPAAGAAPILVAVPESHAGRLFDHVHLRVADVEASKRFYAGALGSLGLGITGEGEGWFSADELFVSDDGPATSGLHVAFQAQDRETVDRFHAAAIEAGGRDNGAPGERSDHPGYYGAYVLDPDGTNVEAVYHGPAKRSTPSVVFSWDE